MNQLDAAILPLETPSPDYSAAVTTGISVPSTMNPEALQSLRDEMTLSADAELAAYHRLASDHFQHAKLHAHQEIILKHIANRRDCLAVIPTGSGKTLCYALPAMVRPGLVLVISPLVSLMRDQLRRFREQGIPAGALDSLQTFDEKREVWDLLESGRLKILMAAPERLSRAAFRERLKSVDLSLIAIDEAHCISQWGNNFRPEYRRIGEFLKDFGNTQTIALTATATERVRREIRLSLQMKDPAVVVGSFHRENLKIQARTVSTVIAQIQAVCEGVSSCRGQGIVYATTRKQVHEVTDALVKAGHPAVAYHAGLDGASRHRAMAEFCAGRIRVIVATNAFGMGIDKADVRFVHHVGMPASIEQYVQEIGRAGRDGAPASCVLVSCSRDYFMQRYMIEKSFPNIENLKAVADGARDFLSRSDGQREADLVRHVRVVVNRPLEEVQACLDVLLREGLLVRFHSTSPPGSQQAFIDESMAEETLITLGYGQEDEKAFWREYPLRKIDQIGRLDSMKQFVEQSGHSGHSGEAVEFLNKYFA